MLTTREHHLSTSSPYSFFAPSGTTTEQHHYENIDQDRLAIHPSCSFLQNRAYHLALLPVTLQPASSPSSASSCSSSTKSSPTSERHFLRSSDVASSNNTARKMTDSDCRDSGSVSFQDEGHEPGFDSIADTSNNGLISEPTDGTIWALISKRDSVQLRIEPRNGFVCFIGMDAASCELVLLSRHGDNTIDGRQAVLVYANGSFHLKDLNSSYGTYINERRVPSRCFVKLSEHDQVRFGFSADVYYLQQIATTNNSSSASSFDEPSKCSFMTFNPVDESDPSESTTAKSGPMKLFRLKSGSRKSGRDKSKEDVSSTTKTASASSKLSPSTSSLMSSASSNSSSSSATSPSSVFMSAMKMMRNRFKKKSSKDKSLVCSGNDDITFIRYDSHSDVASSQSVSAPESPSQPHSRMFRSHTYLDSYSERDLLPEKGETMFARNQFGHPLVEVEHDYDEVTREEEEVATCPVQMSLRLQSFIPNEMEHQELGEEIENGTISTPDSVVKESDNEEDSFDHISGTNEEGEDLYGHVDAFDEFESCTHSKQNLSLENELFEEHQKESSTCSSVVILPHLNSDDRLNNNSSLDTLLTQSILVKSSHCSLDFNEPSTEPDCFKLLSAESIVSIEDDLNRVALVERLEDIELESIDTSGRAAPVISPVVIQSTTTQPMNDLTNSECVCPNYGNHSPVCYPLSNRASQQESLLLCSSPMPLPSTSSTDTRDLQNCLRRANGSWSEEESLKETSECEFDIDDIGHLRRHLTAAPTASAPSTEQMTSQSRNSLEKYRPLSRQQQQAPLSLEDGDVNGESATSKSAGQSRVAVGGMAFVINFDQGSDNGHSTDKSHNERMHTGYHRRLHQKCENQSGTTTTPAASEHFVRQSSSRRSKNVNATLSSSPANRTDELNNERDGNTVKSSNRIHDSLEDKNTKHCAAAATFDSLREITRDSETVASRANVPRLTGEVVHRRAEETTTPHSTTRNDSIMRRNKVFQDPRDKDSSKTSTGSSRRSARSAQLSESAVYLINRMFEDNDYHRYCDESGQPTEPYACHYEDTRLYPSLSHQSMSSSRSASPYSTNQQFHASSTYICNSSSASTRMEYDESLSSLHSNSDSAKRLSHLQSLTTVVQSQSSNQSTLEKQVDSAIDDDGDLIPDDVSEAGTYTVEIDNDGGRHKKKADNEVDDIVDVKPIGRHFDEDSTIAGPTTNTDYEEDADCEVEDNEEGDEEEDKLEVARRKIDELFHVFSNRSQKNNECLESNLGSANVNNATFTRPKRLSQANVSTDDDDETVATSATSDECLVYPTRFEEPKGKGISKKRISNELMSALKKINSKLEKTAKLGKISLDEPKQKAVPVPIKISQNSVNLGKAVPSKTCSAPATPLLSENRKSFRFQRMQPQTTKLNSRKNSNATSISSIDDFDDQSSAVSADTFVRGRSESVNSNSSNQSSMRFNRAFALRRARLGMDTCGVEISEQAANKAKESQVKSAPKKVTPQAFRRNDGGRFSLRAPSASTGNRTRQTPVSHNNKQPAPTKSTIQLKSSTGSIVKPTSVKTKSSYSASASVCSSVENLSSSKTPIARNQHHKRSSTNVTPSIPKKAYSDNEIVQDGESSCDDTPLLSRFGRSSLRQTNTNSSTPWLQSLKANSSNVSKLAKQRISPAQNSSAYNPSIQKSSSFSSNTVKNYPSRGSHLYGMPEQYDNASDTTPNECVRSIPSFQMGKRFFSTKPHQMAQFDRDFSSVARCSSAAATGNSKKLQPDPNLMTHSATESLLSRHVVPSSPGVTNPEVNTPRVEATKSSANITPPINSGINARIFSISPLDSLVISAINQLSSKLRTRMRDLLERERSNHLTGSETRTLIDEILPQVGASAIGMDSRSGQSKNCYSHEPSNISRDLSNILKNLKKVEQIFDVFYMLLEPSDTFHEMSNDQVSVASGSNAIVTHASDSDTSNEGQLAMHHHQQAFNISSNSSKSTGHVRRDSAPLSRFTPHPSSNSPPNNRNGFFIEI